MNIKMNKTTNMILSATLATIFTGCAASGPQFTTLQKPKENTALVYVYRPSSMVGAVISYNIHVKDKENEDKVIGELVNGSYFTYESKAGEVEFWAQTEAKSSVTLDLKPAQMYCIKGEVGLGFLAGRPHLSIVDDNLCKSQLKETKLNIYKANK